MYKEINDPYSQVKWIYNHFNQNVPHITDKPTFAEFDLPCNIEDRIKREGEKIEKRVSLLLWALYIIGFVFCVILFLNIDEHKIHSIWQSFLYTLGTYGWAAFLVYELFLSNPIASFINTLKKRTPLHKSFSKYKDALFAYTYWEETTKLDYWMNLDGHQFEAAVAAVYRSNGYKAVVSKQSGDGGIDIILEGGGKRIAVQCKAHKSPIGPSVARDLYGTMAHFGFDEGVIVSRSGFTTGVYDFVSNKPISLKNLNDLLLMQKSIFPGNLQGKTLPQDSSMERTLCYTVSDIHDTQSSFIRNIEYRNNSLYLTFKTGATYCYYNVPETVYTQMLKSPSKGKFFHEHIKDQYPYY